MLSIRNYSPEVHVRMVAISRLHPWRLLFALALVAVVLAAFACGGSDDGESASSGETAGPVQVRVVADDEGGDLAFEPKEIRARVGQTVRLVLDNQGLALHDFNVEGMPVRSVMATGAEHGGHETGSEGTALHVASDPGQSGELEFVPLEPGTYVFFCSVLGHREAGMEGRIIVS
jgi:uncharacterized cupredoxin-like copper-binding protein